MAAAQTICNGLESVLRTKDLIHFKQRHQECHEGTHWTIAQTLQHFRLCPSTLVVETDLDIHSDISQ